MVEPEHQGRHPALNLISDPPAASRSLHSVLVGRRKVSRFAEKAWNGPPVLYHYPTCLGCNFSLLLWYASTYCCGPLSFACPRFTCPVVVSSSASVKRGRPLRKVCPRVQNLRTSEPRRYWSSPSHNALVFFRYRR